MDNYQELINRLHEEGLGWGIGPAGLCQEAAAAISALQARVSELEKGLTSEEYRIQSEKSFDDKLAEFAAAFKRANG